MQKHNQRLCVYCKKNSPWIWTGKKLKDGSKVYYDDKKHRWGGRRCPVCEKTRIKSSQKFDKFKKQAVIQELRKEGFELKEGTRDLLVEKNNIQYKVRMIQAGFQNGKVLIETGEGEITTDYYAAVFQTVRIISRKQMRAILSEKSQDLR